MGDSMPSENGDMTSNDIDHLSADENNIEYQINGNGDAENGLIDNQINGNNHNNVENINDNSDASEVLSTGDNIQLDDIDLLNCNQGEQLGDQDLLIRLNDCDKGSDVAQSPPESKEANEFTIGKSDSQEIQFSQVL